MDSTGETAAEEARLARRSLLKKAAVAGAAAWTAPMVIESVTNPAGALTCAPGNYHVVYQGGLTERASTTGTGCSHSGTNVTAAAIGLSASFSGACTTTDGGNSIAHILSFDGNCRPVVLQLSGGCTCSITSVWAHVHNRGSGNCPSPTAPPAVNFCWQAGTSGTGALVNGTPLLTSAAFPTTSVTVRPNYTNATVCSSTGRTGIHWGSPNAPGTTGYLVVNVTCT